MNALPDPEDLRSLFARARRHEERVAPTFDAVLHLRPTPRRRRMLPAMATASVLATGLAAGILVLRPRSDPAELRAGSATTTTGTVIHGAKVTGTTATGTETTTTAPSQDQRMKKLKSLGYVGGPRVDEAQRQAAIGALGAEMLAAAPPVPAELMRAGYGGEKDFKANARNEALVQYAQMAAARQRALAEEEREAALGLNTERYQRITENDFLAATENPLSTFSIDVDTASYSVVRRYLTEGRLPPRDAVRIEELLNYFPYTYPAPTGDAPFSVNVEIASCPWSPTHRLARIGLKGEEVQRSARGGTNLVFLIDVSGSMESPDKLPLLKSALKLLVDQLGGSDQVAIVVYAGASGLVLPSTPGSQKSAISPALDALTAGGSTNGGEGLRLAYKIARENFVRGGVNRVILATDGDFNVGVTDHGELLRLVEEQARAGVALTTLGFGMGNYKDDTLEVLADRGNGNHFYIDDEKEARKVLVEQVGGTLVTIAKDVKIQVEFNPRVVGAYRLIGYENRLLKKEDFNDDRKDAGEIGSGHTVTALYELVPPGEALTAPPVDPLKYQTAPTRPSAASGEAFTVKLRYKEPDGDTSQLLSVPVTDGGASIKAASPDLRFAASVASFGLVLRDSAHKGTASLDLSAKLAQEGLGADPGGYRQGFLELVEKARTLTPAIDR